MVIRKYPITFAVCLQMLHATNIVKNMEKTVETKKKPRKGYINELAKLCGCCRQTVSRALFEDAKGEKADFVRKMYRTKYKNIL